MVRPRKAPAEKRLARLPAARVTLDELNHVEGQAEAAGLTAAEYVRRCVLGRQLAPRRSRIEERAIVELIRVGNNLNQMARATHSGNPPLATALTGSLAQLRQALERLSRADAEDAPASGGLPTSREPADGA